MTRKIVFDKVNKKYSNSTLALRDVSLEIEEGEFVFIIGSSGSGKSTLLKLILKEEEISSGEISVFGTNLSSMKKKDIPYYRRTIGIVFQDLRELSGGEKQRVGVARALVNNPNLIIADEPTGNIDPSMSYEIMELLSEINKRGTTVIVVTHDLSVVEKFPFRVIEINNGVIRSDSKDEIVLNNEDPLITVQQTIS